MLVISGASGQLGRATAEHVLARVADAGSVVLATRRPGALAALSDRAQVRHADFDDADSLRHAFAGGTRLLLISTDTIGHRAQQHAAAIDAARDCGVGHVIYTSMIAPGPGNPALIAASHWATEEYLRASGLTWTILRCGLYADFQVLEAADALGSGRLVHNRGAGRCAYLARTDAARAAAAVLAGEGHENACYELTGPDALTAADLAELYSAVGDAPVAPIPVEDEELLALLDSGGTDGHVRYGAALTVSLGQAIRAGHFATCTTAVTDLTGRPAVSVRDLLLRHRAALQTAAGAARTYS